MCSNATVRGMSTTNAIQIACDSVGGQAALARMLSVSPPTVQQWRSGLRPIPAERCPLIERATGGAVRCEDLRPDVAWDVLRMQASQACAETGREVADA